jgi:hypothetical protein
MALYTAEHQAIMAEIPLRGDVLVEMQFKSSTAYLWNGDYPMTSGGREWQPLKSHGRIDGLSTMMDGSANGPKLELPGVAGLSPDFLGLVRGDSSEVAGQPVIFYHQIFDENWQPVGNPILLTFGWMQPPNVSQSEMTEDQGALRGVTIDVLSPFANRGRPSNGALSDTEQKRRHPGDRGLEFKAGLALGITTTYPDN